MGEKRNSLIDNHNTNLPKKKNLEDLKKELELDEHLLTADEVCARYGSDAEKVKFPLLILIFNLRKLSLIPPYVSEKFLTPP